jgi:heme/copper-type cytochrome/quinol oxidase subunit 3
MTGLAITERRRRRAGGPPRRHDAWSNGMWGMALFVTTEAALFGVLIATYFYLRFDAVHWPPRGVPEPSLLYPFLLLGGLVASAVLTQLAALAAHRRLRVQTVAWLAGALVLQIPYLVLEILLFRRDLHDFSPQDTAYASAYFTLLALHHAHVALGILLVAFVLLRSSRGLTTYRARGIQAVALYWLVVAALAVAVTLTTLSPAL